MNKPLSIAPATNRPGEDFLAYLDAQRAEFSRMLPQRFAALEMMRDRLAAGETFSSGVEDFERGAHSLAGSAGTFGFPEIGRAAKALETAVQRLRESDAAPAAARTPQIAAALEFLKQSFSTGDPRQVLAPPSP